MNAFLAILCLGVISIWDYPARQMPHQVLRNQFIVAQKKGDLQARVNVCREGVALLPEDPVWHYNLACSLALNGDKPADAFDALERAIDLGFRHPDMIARDSDFVKVAGLSRFKDLVAEAKAAQNKPLFFGPGASVASVGLTGKPLVIGAQNLSWDLEIGCFDAKIKLIKTGQPFDGFLYMNRDGRHSNLAVTNYPGLTSIVLDSEGRAHQADLDYPNMKFAYPLFGNCSRALVKGPFWRSLPRALMTGESSRIMTQAYFYLANQVWVFPATRDYDFTSENAYGDIFTSVTPYWFVTEGRSWSDQYYLRAALLATQAFQPSVREEILRHHLLAPTLQMLVRRALRTVENEADYLTKKAHPTAFPPNGLDLEKLKKMASELRANEIPPIAKIASVRAEKIREGNQNRENSEMLPELTYFSPCAWAFILRADEAKRVFYVQAAGGADYEFAIVHDANGAASIEKLNFDFAKITINREKLSATNRVDLAVFAKSETSKFGAPSFVSFAILDEKAPYCDPVLLPRTHEQ